MSITSSCPALTGAILVCENRLLEFSLFGARLWYILRTRLRGFVTWLGSKSLMQSLSVSGPTPNRLCSLWRASATNIAVVLVLKKAAWWVGGVALRSSQPLGRSYISRQFGWGFLRQNIDGDIDDYLLVIFPTLCDRTIVFRSATSNVVKTHSATLGWDASSILLHVDGRLAA